MPVVVITQDDQFEIESLGIKHLPVDWLRRGRPVAVKPNDTWTSDADEKVSLSRTQFVLFSENSTKDSALLHGNQANFANIAQFANFAPEQLFPRQ
jgi:hypothetical protein